MFKTSSTGNVVGADLDEDHVHSADRLPQTILGQRTVGDVEHEIGDERLLERRGEALDELGGQPADEPHRVRDEIPLAEMVEATRRRVEGLEEAVVDGRVRAGERVEERRLPDVRVARERDRRRRRARALLAPHGALHAEPAQASLQQRHTRAREPAVGLELRLTRAARADTAAESLQVLPHPPHARQVVLELRELYLKLALGAAGVLREDVEDQLRAIDDTCLQCVLERSLLRRRELLVHQEHVGTAARELRLELGELPLADERPRIRTIAVLDQLGYRVDARGAGELTELRELFSAVRAFREHAENEPALRLRPRLGIGLARCHRESVWPL